jgi:NAD(P)-dependent dehydrogenase (short-subunit alcohol dehydrogenase family)
MSDRVRGPKLDGRVAVITGAGSGLGRRSALLFAEEGARVVVADINADRTHQVAAEIVAAGGMAVAAPCDVSVESDVRALVEVAIEKFGSLDVMFNNAGIPLVKPFVFSTEAEMRRVLDVNLLGVMFGCKYAFPALRANGSGVILNTSSAAALVAIPNNSVYAATKGAINALTRDLAVEFGPYNIRVNALCSAGGMSANMLLPADAPLWDEDAEAAGWNPAESMFPLAMPRPPRVLDHANVALFLASDDAAWCSGVCLPVDGAVTGKVAFDMSRFPEWYQEMSAPMDRYAEASSHTA